MAHVTRVVRAVPLWLLADYLRAAGGRESPTPNTFEGDGWSVTLTQVEDFVIGSLCVGQVRLEIVGDDGAVEKLVAALEPRLLRAGG